MIQLETGWGRDGGTNLKHPKFHEKRLPFWKSKQTGCFQKYGYPEMDDLQWKTLLKWMIWGYHYFLETSNWKSDRKFGGLLAING